MTMSPACFQTAIPAQRTPGSGEVPRRARRSVCMALLAVALGLGTSSAPAADATADRVRQALDVELPKRFARADANHDGRLTREEARGAMPRVAAHFERIDTAGRGYVTERQIRDAVETQLLPRLAEMQAGH